VAQEARLSHSIPDADPLEHGLGAGMQSLPDALAWEAPQLAEEDAQAPLRAGDRGARAGGAGAHYRDVGG
jgi:hypothetical protein